MTSNATDQQHDLTSDLRLAIEALLDDLDQTSDPDELAALRATLADLIGQAQP